MKRRSLLLLMIPVALLVTQVPGSGQDKDKKAAEFKSEFFPLQVGHRWTYVGNDGKERVVVTVEKQEPIKRKIKTPSGDKTETIPTYFLRITSGDKSLQEQIFVAEDGVYRLSAAGKDISPPLKFLSLPPKKGETWTIDSESEAIKLRGSFALDQSAVTVPLGNFNAWTSATRDFFLGEHKLEATYAFAAEVGIVQQHVKLGKFDLKLQLEKFEPAGGATPPTLKLPALPALPTLPLPPAPK